MKKAYPVILSQGEKFIVAYVPDFEINTQDTDIADAIEMAKGRNRGCWHWYGRWWRNSTRADNNFKE